MAESRHGYKPGDCVDVKVKRGGENSTTDGVVVPSGNSHPDYVRVHIGGSVPDVLPDKISPTPSEKKTLWQKNFSQKVKEALDEPRKTAQPPAKQ